MNLFKIYTGDYSKDGYNDGIKDGKKQKAKNKYKFFKAVNPINYIWNFNNSYESFAKNYDIGYTDGQRVKHEIYTKGGNMSENTYTYQLQILHNARNNLEALKKKMLIVRDQYERQIQAAKNAGFMEDYIEQLRAKFSMFSQRIDDTQNLISRHEDRIDDHERIIRDLISQANQA